MLRKLPPFLEVKQKALPTAFHKLTWELVMSEPAIAMIMADQRLALVIKRMERREEPRTQ